MGLQIDIAKLLGLKKTSQCPKCKKTHKNYFEDYDIECGEPNPKPGMVVLDNCCPYCEHSYKTTFIVKTQQQP